MTVCCDTWYGYVKSTLEKIIQPLLKSFITIFLRLIDPDMVQLLLPNSTKTPKAVKAAKSKRLSYKSCYIGNYMVGKQTSCPVPVSPPCNSQLLLAFWLWLPAPCLSWWLLSLPLQSASFSRQYQSGFLPTWSSVSLLQPKNKRIITQAVTVIINPSS